MNTIDESIKIASNNIIKEVKQLSKITPMDTDIRRVYNEMMKIATEYYLRKESTMDNLVDILFIQNNIYEILKDSVDDYILSLKAGPENPREFIMHNLNIIKQKSRNSVLANKHI